MAKRGQTPRVAHLRATLPPKILFSNVSQLTHHPRGGLARGRAALACRGENRSNARAFAGVRCTNGSSGAAGARDGFSFYRARGGNSAARAVVSRPSKGV